MVPHRGGNIKINAEGRVLEIVIATAAAATLWSSMLVATPVNAAQRVSGEETPATGAASDRTASTAAHDLEPEVFLEGLEQLEASSVQREIAHDEGLSYYRYTVDAGSLVLPRADDVRAALEAEDAARAPREFTPYLEGRFSGGKTAVGFNTIDQQALASGGGAAIAAAICLLPGVGWAACAVVGIVVSVTTTYLVKNGICSGGRKLWWYDVRGGSTVACRSTAPF